MYNRTLYKPKQNLEQNYINHIGLVIDQSLSMNSLKNEVIKVTDNQVSYLAKRSQELDQETRATLYLFNDSVDCIHYDKDVLRLPSLANRYRPNGMTALVDATLKCIGDLEKTPELYGDHAFLIYVITDGEENASTSNYRMLSQRLSKLRDNWTVAVLVPNQQGVFEAKKFGFPAQNISIWDTTAKGLVEAGNVIRKATDTWMENRSKGVRGSTNLFQLDVSNLDVYTVNNTLQHLNPNQYHLLNVRTDSTIRPFVEYALGSYRLGSAYYQMTKKETIQANKLICVIDKNTGVVYTGTPARNLLGLPDYKIDVKPADHNRYDIYVQSTSVNRKLIAGTKVLVLK